MKRRWLTYIAGGFLVLLIAAAIGTVSLYWYLEPSRYFSRVEHPVLGVDRSHQTPQAYPTLQITELLRPSLPILSTPPQPDSATTPTTPDSPAKSDPAFNVLILGIDEATGGVSRTDVIMLAHVDPLTKKVSLLSIPRDTKVKMEGVGYTKINHAHVLGSLHGGNHSGTMATIQSVTDLLGVPINYYVKVSFTGFEHFVDQIGGINVDLPQPIGPFPQGMNHLNGGQALDAARERYSLPRGDMDRQANQGLILKSIVTQVLRPDNIPKIPALYQNVKTDLIDTNFTDTDLLSLSLLFQGITGEAIHYVQLPGRGASAMDPLVKVQLYYWVPDQTEVKTLIDSMMTNQ